MDNLAGFARKAKQLKEAMNFGDVAPFIHVFPSDILVPLAPFDDEIKLAQMLTNINISYGDIHSVVLIADAYRTKDDSNAAPGSLQQRWETGDRDEITESVLVVLIDSESSNSVEMDFEAESKSWLTERKTSLADALVKSIQLGAFSQSPSGEYAHDHRRLIKQAQDNRVLQSMTKVVVDAQINAALAGQAVEPRDVVASLYEVCNSSTHVNPYNYPNN